MPHPNDPLHDEVHSILARSQLGELKWVQPIDVEGSPLGVFEAVDSKEEMAYRIMDGACDAEEEPENQCGPSITSYCYDVGTQERETVPDEMVIHKYADSDVQESLVALLAFAAEHHTVKRTNVPGYGKVQVQTPSV